jgi:predicted NUDIX family NTP pyrophosphohydrolase
MKLSAGVILYRRANERLEVLLAHPGGPYWRRKDAGAWSIPKGERRDGEEPLAAALREFEEETGIKLEGELERQLEPLGEVKQAGGKIVHAWTIERDCDPTQIHSNTFSLEWPPKSGKIQEFPEIDRFEWFPIAEARQKLVKAQTAFLDRLAERVSMRSAY